MHFIYLLLYHKAYEKLYKHLLELTGDFSKVTECKKIYNYR